MRNEELVARFYEGIKESDSRKLSECVHRNFELTWQGSTQIPWAGTWTGVTGLLDFFSTLSDHATVIDIDVQHTVANEDVTIVILRGKWSVGPQSTELEARAANVFAFEGERIRSYMVLNDTEAFAKALEGTQPDL